MLHKTTKRFKVWLTLLLVLAIYIASYLMLSAGGCYEPSELGLGFVRRYAWAPRGFVSGYVWKGWPIIIYAPLYYADEQLWHTQKKADSGQYPVDEVDGKDVWKVHRAWMTSEPSKAEADKPTK